MKKAAVTFLALLILATTAKDALMYLGYKANQGFIATVLCINRDKPDMQCKGKCYLKKKISESKEQDRGSAPVPQPDEQKQSVYFPPPSLALVTATTLTDRVSIFSETLLPGRLAIADIFQPPRA